MSFHYPLHKLLLLSCFTSLYPNGIYVHTDSIRVILIIIPKWNESLNRKTLTIKFTQVVPHPSLSFW